MNRWIANLLGLSAMGALGICGWAFYQVGSTVQENRSALHKAALSAQEGIPDVFAESRDVTIALLRPCKAGKPDTCGLIPAVRSVADNAGAATVAMQTQIQQTQPLIAKAAVALQETSAHANKAIDAATAATEQARVDLKTMDGSLAATRPLLEAYTRSGEDLNAILERKAIGDLLDNVANITLSGSGILADGKKVTDKATADYLTPQPWYIKARRYASDAFDYGALLARHVP